MSIRTLDGTLLDLDAPLKYVRQAGLLVGGQLRKDGVQEFTLPATPTNLAALQQAIAPDTANRLAFVPVVCEVGNYDRLYIKSATDRIACKLEASDDPFVKAQRTRLNDIDCGSFSYIQPLITLRQGQIDKAIDGDFGEQYPDIQYGQSPELSAEDRSHGAFGQYRPWISPHWLLNKALCQLGYKLYHPATLAPAIRADIAYLLHKDVGAGMEQNKRAVLSSMEHKRVPFGPTITRNDPIYQPRTPIRAHRLEDPSGDVYTNEFYIASSGWYSLEATGLVGCVRAGKDESDGVASPEVHYTVYDSSRRFRLATRTLTATRNIEYLQGDPEAQNVQFFTFKTDAKIWLSEGEVLRFSASPPDNFWMYLNPASWFGLDNTGQRSVTLWPGVAFAGVGNPVSYQSEQALQLKITMLRSWFSFGSKIDWRSILRGDVTVLDLIKGIAHVYQLTVDYNAATRTVSMLPTYEVNYDGATIEGYIDETNDPQVIDLIATSPTAVTFDPAQRPSELTIGYDGGDEATDYTEVVPTLAPNESSYSSRNPLFQQVDIETYESANDLAIEPPLPGQSVAFSAPAGQSRVAPLPTFGDDEPEWDIAPTLLRYFGKDAVAYVANNPNIRDDEQAALSFPEGTLPSATSMHAKPIAYAAYVAILKGETVYGDGLAYRDTYPAFWQREFADRYRGVELALTYQAYYADANEIDLRSLALIPYEGRPTMARIMAIEGIDGERCRVRAVTAGNPCDAKVTNDITACATNGVRVDAYWDEAANEAYATKSVFGLASPTAITFEVSYANGPREPYSEGERIIYRGGGLYFRVTVEYDKCPTITGGAEVGVIVQQLACGDVPQIVFTYDAEANTVVFERGADLTDYPRLDEFTVSIDGSEHVPYTPGEVIEGFTNVEVIRNAQRLENCPILSNSAIVDASTLSTPPTRSRCNNAPEFIATTTPGGTTFSIGGDIESDYTHHIYTRIQGQSEWRPYQGVPVRGQGAALLEISYNDECPDFKSTINF